MKPACRPCQLEVIWNATDFDSGGNAVMSSLYRWLWLAFLLNLVKGAQEYHEDLLLQPLPPGQLLASFNFRGETPLSAYKQQHFQYFPRALGQVLQNAHTHELHLRFSTGRWDPGSWGSRPSNGTKEGGTGVELWAWVEADTEEEAFGRWRTLNHALSGLFCASMNFIDSTQTSRPLITFQPQGDHLDPDLTRLHLLHGTLPHEVVCTENLTPFLKQLPCKGKAGVASLLDGHKLFDSSWQTMAIDVYPVCNGSGSGCSVNIEQTIDMVLDIERSKRSRDDPIPRPVPRDRLICAENRTYATDNACFPLDLAQEQSYGMEEVFGRKIRGTCLASRKGDSELAEPSVCINVPNEKSVYATEGVKEYKFPSGDRRCMIVPDDKEADFYFDKEGSDARNQLAVPPLYAERYITGRGQERGGISSLLTNPSSKNSVEFVYFETLPWYMKPYLHTLKVQVNGEFVQRSTIIRETFYKPGLDRERGTQLEMRLIVPPASTLTLSYEFEKAILRYTEYPPDANRGFDVAPAIIRVLHGPAEPGTFLRTTSLLLPLPTPDFSMPYNVIILTSTVLALAFGSIFTSLTRRFVAADEVPRDTLMTKVKERIGIIRARFSKDVEEKKKQ